jgi:hypothetical protein
MGPRVKRRRLTDPEDFSDDICQPASRLEKDSWNGFCEIESEPVCVCLEMALAVLYLRGFRPCLM